MTRVSTRSGRTGWQALAVGLAATASVLVAYIAGGLDWLELKTLDLRFVLANSIREHADLVCLDIDDAALQRVGRWPWPRDVQAGILSVLHELGVRALLVDLTLGEPEPVRPILPRQADIADDPLNLLRTAEHSIVYALPDRELRSAIAGLGRVYLATDYAAGRAPGRRATAVVDEAWQRFLESDQFAALVAAFERGDAQAAARQAAAIRPRRSSTAAPPWAPLLWAQAVAALQGDPALSDDALLHRLAPQDRTRLRPALERCREAALRRRILDWLTEEPARQTQRPAQLFETLTRELIADQPRYRELLAQTLRYALGYRATLHDSVASPVSVGSVAAEVDAVSPVYFEHARAARRCGFVVFEPDRDGVMRRTRLLVQHGGHVLGQLAFSVALDELGVRPEDISARPGWLVLNRRDGAPPLRIQLDREGRALVPWVARRDWSRQFGAHVPVGALYQVFDRRQAIAHNRRLILERLRALPPSAPLNCETFVEDLATRLRLEERRREARYAGDVAAVRETDQLSEQAERLLSESEAEFRLALRAALERLPSAVADAPDAVDPQQVAVLREVDRALRAIDEYRAEIEAIQRHLRPRIAGKIGILGYTATALADMAPIPTHARAPGMLAHANLLNGLLSGRMVYWAPPGMNAALAAALGLLATLLTRRYGPRATPVLVGLVLGYIGLAGGLAFWRWTYWLALMPVVGVLLLAPLAVLLHRYLFLERETRQLATALSQYTSATLARQMAENAELCRRAETREVTAVFTDLAGFTTLSERIGAERTQHVLNVTLGRLSDVLLHYEGMINKFIGDGIFAFWNPVIYPQPDHARRACAAAVDLLAALEELRRQQRQRGGDEAFDALVLRIGVATGNAVVGPCGSEKKYDYTCIGDSVNVAARLESANKFYGTRTLVSGATREQAGDEFAFRPLGGVQVKGKTQAVPIFELLGRTAEVTPEELEYAHRFADAVAAFQARDWSGAYEAFLECQQRKPDDLAAARYLAAVRACRAHPPPEPWTGALELTEK